MVLTAMTDTHVFVVSDRRMTNAKTGEIMSSAENKAVVLNGQMVLTYTGFCDLGGLPTDAWVASVLANEAPENWIQVLLNRTGPAVRQIRVPSYKQRHAFLLTGYVKTPKGRRAFRPAGFLISNFHSRDGKVLDIPESKFSLSLLKMGNWKVRIDSIGRDLSNQRRLALERSIRTQLRATPQQPLRVLDVLGEEIRRISQTDSGVGSDLMAVSFPIQAVGSGLNILIDPAAAEWRTQLIAFYASADSAPVSYGPADIRPGLQILGLSVSLDPTTSPAIMHRMTTKWPPS